MRRLPNGASRQNGCHYLRARNTRKQLRWEALFSRDKPGYAEFSAGGNRSVSLQSESRKASCSSSFSMRRGKLIPIAVDVFCWRRFPVMGRRNPAQLFLISTRRLTHSASTRPLPIVRERWRKISCPSQFRLARSATRTSSHIGPWIKESLDKTMGAAVPQYTRTQNR